MDFCPKPWRSVDRQVDWQRIAWPIECDVVSLDLLTIDCFSTTIDRDTTHHQLPLAKVTPLQKKSHSNLSPLTRDFKILNIGGIHHFVGFCLHQIITNIQGWSWYLYLCHQHWSSLPWNISRGDDWIFIPTFHIDFLNEFQI